MGASEIIENVHIELVLHPDCKNKDISLKVQLVAMATASDKFNKNGLKKRCIFETGISQKMDLIKLFNFCCIEYNSDTLQWDTFQ